MTVQNPERHTSDHSVEDKPNLDGVSRPSSSCLCHVTHTLTLLPVSPTVYVKLTNAQLKKTKLNGYKICCHSLHMDVRCTVFDFFFRR